MFLKGDYPAPFANIYPANSKGQVQWGRGKRVNVMDILQGGEPEPIPVPTPKPAPEVKPTFWASITNYLNSIFGRA